MRIVRNLPYMWDVTVAGVAAKGDSSQSAAEREALEELGLALDSSDKRPHFTVNSEAGFDFSTEKTLAALHHD